MRNVKPADAPAPVTLESFVSEIKSIRYFSPDGQPLKTWLLFTADTWDAARNAAWNAARNAAWNAAADAAWNAAWNAAADAAWNAAADAAWNAAWDAAWDAAWNAAWNAAWDAAWNAARNAAWNAARNAADFASIEIVCADLDLAPEHREHIRARMDVWRKGYALLCDVGGKLYVYAATKPARKKK